MRNALLAAVVGLASAWNSAAGQATPAHEEASAAREAILATSDALTWSPAPAVLPSGARVAVLSGDPAKPGAFTMRLSAPDGYRIPPHFHAADEHVTVLSGTALMGMGDTFDESRLTELPVGSFAVMPPGMRHFFATRGATVVQVHAVGPWSLTYVNPADDPRNQPR